LPTPRPLRASRLDRYEDYLLARWSQGERNAARLYHEIQERGYPGSASLVRAYVSHLRTTTADGSLPRSRKERAKSVSPEPSAGCSHASVMISIQKIRPD
jgi:transposase